MDFCSRVHDQGKLTFVYGDTQDPPFEDEYQRVVTNIESSHCYGAHNLFYRDVHRALKAGGCFCYTECCTVPTRRFKVERYLDKISFEMERSEGITDSVIHSLKTGNEALTRLMHEAIEHSHTALKKHKKWLSDIQLQYNRYVDGQLAYELWNFRKQ